MQTYFIHSPRSRQVKIGRSADPAARLRDLQTAHGSKLVLLGVLDGDHEDAYHRKHQAARQVGEWFEVSSALAGDVFQLFGHRLEQRAAPRPLQSDLRRAIEEHIGAPLLPFDEPDIPHAELEQECVQALIAARAGAGFKDDDEAAEALERVFFGYLIAIEPEEFIGWAARRRGAWFDLHVAIWEPVSDARRRHVMQALVEAAATTDEDPVDIVALWPLLVDRESGAIRHPNLYNAVDAQLAGLEIEP